PNGPDRNAEARVAGRSNARVTVSSPADTLCSQTVIPMTTNASRIFVGALLALWVLAGCVAGVIDDAPETADDALEVSAVPALHEYVILAGRSIDVGNRGVVAGGALGVAASATQTPGLISGGADARLGVGQILLAEAVVLLRGAAAGEIGAGRVLASQATTGPRS